MHKYRITYFSNLYLTHHFVRASTPEEAEQKFRAMKGDNPKIITIKEVEE